MTNRNHPNAEGVDIELAPDVVVRPPAANLKRETVRIQLPPRPPSDKSPIPPRIGSPPFVPVSPSQPPPVPVPAVPVSNPVSLEPKNETEGIAVMPELKKETARIPLVPERGAQNSEQNALFARLQKIVLAPRKRSYWVFLVVCCLLGLLVFKAMLHMIATDTGKARRVHASSPVETVPVRRQTLEEVIGGSGTVQQFNTVLLTTQIAARVLEVPVWIGDIVKKGDLLVRWDDRLIQATLDANRQFVETSNIKIKNETRQVERYTALEKQHMGTPLDLEKAEIALADAYEQLAKATMGLREAEIALERVQMKAPIEGIVLERLVNPDEITHNDQIVMKLGAIDKVLMAAKVTEEKIHSLQVDLPAEVTFPAFPAETFQGKVFKIDPNIDPVTRTFTVYIQIENRPYIKTATEKPSPLHADIKTAIEVPLTLHAEDFRLKPGLSGFAHIHRTAKDVTAIPSVAIMNPSGDRASVFVVDSRGHANLRNVSLGIVVNAMTEVTGGLKEGEKVVTVGQLYLQENDKVHSTSKSNIAK
jgi:RND family efflux transporter MFP subunit